MTGSGRRTPYEPGVLILGGEVITCGGAGLGRLAAIDDGAPAPGRISGVEHAERGAPIGLRPRQLEPGERADLMFWSEPDHRRVIDRFGHDGVRQVQIEGRTTMPDGRLVEPRRKRAIA